MLLLADLRLEFIVNLLISNIQNGGYRCQLTAKQARSKCKCGQNANKGVTMATSHWVTSALAPDTLNSQWKISIIIISLS